jgi:hypothetical protein
MRRILLFTMTGLGLASVLVPASARNFGDSPKEDSARSAEVKPSPKEASCGNYGTAVEFVNTPSEAARQAKRDQKLVFVLHVSGLFEDPKLT